MGPLDSEIRVDPVAACADAAGWPCHVRVGPRPLPWAERRVAPSAVRGLLVARRYPSGGSFGVAMSVWENFAASPVPQETTRAIDAASPSSYQGHSCLWIPGGPPSRLKLPQPGHSFGWIVLRSSAAPSSRARSISSA